MREEKKYVYSAEEIQAKIDAGELDGPLAGVPVAVKAQEYYPGFTRHIYLQSLRYNLHLKPRALLIEAGSQLNTVEEEKNAMEPLADILDRVLAGR